MYFSATYLTVKIVQKYPGLDIEKLAQKISDSGARPNVIFYLLNTDNFQLNHFLSERLLCVEFRNSGYYFILNSERFHYFDNVNRDLQKIFAQEEQAMIDQTKRKKSKPSGD